MGTLTKISAAPTPSKKVIDEMSKLAANSRLPQMRKALQHQSFIMGEIAVSGELTMIYAAPGTGKTLLTLKLLSEALVTTQKGKLIYYINLDDSFQGNVEKIELGVRYGFEVFTPAEFSNPSKDFQEVVDKLIKVDIASDVVIVLDTIKKFVDIMDKKSSSNFMSSCRRFTAEGGSIIALAHINKNRSQDGTAIPAGTSDTLDDCDCAYVLDLLDEEKIAGGVCRKVEFQQRKSRAPVAQSAVYSYSKINAESYEQMFDSVKLVDPDIAEKARQKKIIRANRQADSALILAISSCLKGDKVKKGELVEQVMNIGKFSRSNIKKCLDRWSCAAEDGGLWSIESGDNNSKFYKLLKKP